MSLPKTAVLIDGDYLRAADRGRGRKTDLRGFVTKLRTTFGDRTEVFLFLSIRAESEVDIRASLQDIDCHLSTIPLVRQGTRLVSKGLDVALAVAGGKLGPDVDRLVLVSGDADFAELLKSAKGAARSTTVVALPLAIGTKLAEAANFFVDLEEFELPQGALASGGRAAETIPELQEGLVRPGEVVNPFLAVRAESAKAKRELTVIDAYADEQVLLMARRVPKGVRIQIFAKGFDQDAMVLARKLRQEGYDLSLFPTKVPHDRWFRVDDDWWHSGHSFKDLGMKYSRISRVGPAEVSRHRNMEEALAKSSTAVKL